MSSYSEDEISDLIDKLTTNGTEILDPALVKKLKSYCKTLSQNKDETSYDYLVRVIFRQMEKNHAQIRYGCFLVIEYLFEKAHLFRKIISTKKLSKLFKLCFDLGSFNQRQIASTLENSEGSSQAVQRSQRRRPKRNPLLPRSWAKKLKLKVAQVVRYWNEEFGRSYSTLQCALRFLEINGVEFEDPEIEAQRIEERLRVRSLEQFEAEFDTIQESCDALIMQIDNSFELLIPRFEFIGDENDEDDQDSNFNFRPMRGLSFNIFLNRQVEIVQDDTNCDIIANLKDLCRQLHSIHQNSLLPLGDKLSKLQFSSLRLERLNDKHERLCAQILTIVCKSNDMKIVTNSAKNQDDEDDDDDDDFEDVPQDEEAEYITRMMKLEEEAEAKTSLSFFNESPCIGLEASSSKQHLNEDIDKANTTEIESEASSSSTANNNATHQCRALLPSGRLCPRQDKQNCPFHGRIIDRDNEGLPTDAEQRKAELDRRAEQKINEWRDPHYLKLLSERTGIDLTGTATRRKRKRYPNLIDIKVDKSTPRKRLLRRFGKKKLQQLAGIQNIR